MHDLSKIKAQLKDWRENPIKFVYDNFKVDPDAWQREALLAFPSDDDNKRRISLQACAGPGKSAVLAWCGWNFLCCYGEPGDHPKGAAVSVTNDNLSDNLWPEFSKWQSRSKFLLHFFTWTKSRIHSTQNPETWFLAARGYSKTANEEEQGRTLSGLHGKYVLALMDESGDIPPAVAKAAEQALSTNPKFGKILQAGNPTSLEGILHAAATTLRHLWYVIRITGDPDDPNRSPRIDINWAREQIKTYGRDNPWVMSYILGLFPPASINTLFGPDEVATAMKKGIRESDYDFSQKRLGIDVARFGDDLTVVFPRQGLRAFNPVIMRHADNPSIAARIALSKNKWGSEMEFVDDTGGYGGGVIDFLRQAGHSPQAVNASSKAMNSQYFNKRAECWFLMREWLRRGGVLPNIPDLQRELTAPTYSFKDGKLILEPKDQIKARLGKSPDHADALALTFAFPDMPSLAHSQVAMNAGKSFNADWNPYSAEHM